MEEAILNVLGDAQCVVTGIPDDQRGERLVALYVHPTLTPADLHRKISETDMPRLWIPKRENLYPVESLPLLGTGKLDLRAVRDLAGTGLAACPFLNLLLNRELSWKPSCSPSCL